MARLPRTSLVIDGVSFYERVTNLVAIDNAIGSRQPNVPSSSNQVSQVDPQVLKKALEECTIEIKTSEKRIEDLNSRSMTVQQFSYQVLGFFLVFQAAILAVMFNQTTVYVSNALKGIIVLSLIVGFLCFAIIMSNGIYSEGLKVTMEEERLEIYKRYKRKLLLHGVAFQFYKHQEVKPLKRKWGVNRLFYVSALFYVVIIIFVCNETQRRIFSARQSALEAAAAPAPVQSGTSPGKTWCVAKAGSPDIDLMNGLSFACGEGGADCGPIQAGGACFSPDTIVSHASFAYNSYYQNKGRNPSYCYFGGTSIITITTPSYLRCSFL